MADVSVSGSHLVNLKQTYIDLLVDRATGNTEYKVNPCVCGERLVTSGGKEVQLGPPPAPERSGSSRLKSELPPGPPPDASLLRALWSFLYVCASFFCCAAGLPSFQHFPSFLLCGICLWHVAWNPRAQFLRPAGGFLSSLV